MKNILLGLLLLFLISITSNAQDYCNFIFMNHEIKHTLEEHERQKKIKDNEATSNFLELKNKKRWEKLKEKVNKIQDRLKILNPALEGIPAFGVAVQDYKIIIKNEKKILEELLTLPPNIQNIIHEEIKFTKDLQLTTQFFMGLIASYSKLGQMERSERKILYDYGLQEIKKLRSKSYYLLFLICEAKRKEELQNAKIKYIINRDKQLIEDIMNNFNDLLQ